jgi:hypothetical protein
MFMFPNPSVGAAALKRLGGAAEDVLVPLLEAAADAGARMSRRLL